MAKQSPKTRTNKNVKKKSSTSTTKRAASVAAAKKPAKKTASTSKTASASANRRGLSRVFRKPTLSRRAAGSALSVGKLTNWNRALALLYVLEGAAILALSTAKSLPVFASYQASDTLASRAGELARVPALEHLMDVNVPYLLAGICFVFALAHLLAGTFYRRRYENDLATNTNRLRWTSYAVGLGGVMLVVALLCGVHDVVTLGLVVVLTLLTSIIGASAELPSAVRARGTLYTVGFIAFITAWVVLAAYLINAGLYNGDIPNFVYWLFVSTLALSFVLTSTLRAQQAGVGNVANYLVAERRYMVVAFLLVTAVVWQVYAGMLQ